MLGISTYIYIYIYILIWVPRYIYIYIYTYSNLGDTTDRAAEVYKAYRAHKVYRADI